MGTAGLALFSDNLERDETTQERHEVDDDFFLSFQAPADLGCPLLGPCFHQRSEKEHEGRTWAAIRTEHTRYNGYCMHAWYIHTGERARHGWERYPLHIWFFCFWFFFFFTLGVGVWMSCSVLEPLAPPSGWLGFLGRDGMGIHTSAHDMAWRGMTGRDRRYGFTLDIRFFSSFRFIFLQRSDNGSYP